MRQAWTEHRPIEARVSGKFPYLPYEPVRGASERKIKVDLDKLLSAKANLAGEVERKPTAQARQALGKLFLLEADFDEAQRQLRLALKESPNDPSIYVDLAALFYEQGALEQSTELLRQSVEYSEAAIKLSPSLPEAWFNLALCREQMMLLTEAEADWKKYLELDPSSKWADEARSRRDNLSRRRVGNLAPPTNDLMTRLLAADAAERESEVHQLLTERFAEASRLAAGPLFDGYLQALLNRDLPGAARARRILERIAGFGSEVKNDRYLSDLLEFTARADHRRLAKEQDIRRQLQAGENAIKQRRFDQAMASYLSAQVEADRIGDYCHGEEAQFGVARTYHTAIETSAMLKQREALVEEAGRRGHRFLQVRALLALSNAYGASQMISQNLDACRQAYRVATELGDADQQISAMNAAGWAYAGAGEIDRALSSNYELLQLLRVTPVNPLRLCQVHTQVARAFSLAGDHRTGLEYQSEALPYCEGRDDLIAAAHGRAALYAQLAGRDDEVLPLLRRAMTTAEAYSDRDGRSRLIPDLYTMIGRIFMRRLQVAEALSAYQTALKEVAGTSHKNYQSIVHQGLAQAFLKLGRLDEAEAELKQSISLLDGARSSIRGLAERSDFTNRAIEVYRTMVDFQYRAKGAPEVAYAYAEVYRNRELLEAVAGGAQAKIGQAVGEYLAEASPLTLKQVQQALPDNAQLIQYAISDQGLIIWLISRDAFASELVLCDPQSLQAQVSEFLAAIIARDAPDLLKERGSELYKILIEPVAARLDSQRALIVVADEPINALPFSALFSRATRRYLVEDYLIVNSPSASILPALLRLGRSKSRQPVRSLLAVSNPVINYKVYRLDPLREADREVAAVLPFYPEKLHLSGRRATKGALLKSLGDYDVVHLATHSLINERRPLFSMILLSPDEEPAQPEEAVHKTFGEESLRSMEVFNLRLSRTRLVILSSCRSGINGRLNANGFGGITHAFFSAQASAVIASLWDVNDAGAAQLMQFFHRAYMLEKKSSAAALRQAQLTMIKSEIERWRHPYYWGAFMLSGDGLNS